MLLVSLLPIVAVNVWHSALLSKRNKVDKLQTISQHAADNPRLLLIHRIVHISLSVIIIVLALDYLLPNNYLWAGVLLIAAAIFDILEVITLNKKSSVGVIVINYHTVTAWAMSLCYLLYASLMIIIAGLPSWFVAVIWVLLLALLILSTYRKFERFWITQHIYFCFLSVTIMVAHALLFIKSS